MRNVYNIIKCIIIAIYFSVECLNFIPTMKQLSEFYTTLIGIPNIIYIHTKVLISNADHRSNTYEMYPKYLNPKSMRN